MITKTAFLLGCVALASTLLGASSAEAQTFVGGSVEQGPMHVVGTLERDDIDRVVGETTAFSGCYRDALQRNPRLAGSIVLTWHVSPAGSTTEAGVHRSDLADRSLESCFLSAIAALRFERKPVRQAVVMLPLTLTSDGRIPVVTPPPPRWPRLPDQLTATQVRNVIERHIADIAFCRTWTGQPSWPPVQIVVTMTVEGSGRVREARTNSPNPAGRCVLDAVQRMVFPAFSGPDMLLSYPFRL